MRFLLRPAWLALITTVTLFVIACYAVLAPWQFGREADRDAQQQALDTASTIPPAPLAQVLPPDGVTSAVEWRQVTVTGLGRTVPPRRIAQLAVVRSATHRVRNRDSPP